MAEHTPGPWHVGAGNGINGIFSDEGRQRLEKGITTLYGICEMTTDWNTTEDKANAQRIVAAVNACEGIPTDKLEECGPSYWPREVDRLREQNTELLGALRRLVSWGQGPLACPDCGKVEDCLPDCSFEHAVTVIGNRS